MDLGKDDETNDNNILRTSLDLIDIKTDKKLECDFDLESNNSQNDLSFVSNK